MVQCGSTWFNDSFALLVPISQDHFEGEEDEGDVEPEDDAAAMDDDNEVGNHQVGSISENDLDVMSKTEALLEALYPETNAASSFSAPNSGNFCPGQLRQPQAGDAQMGSRILARVAEGNWSAGHRRHRL